MIDKNKSSKDQSKLREEINSLKKSILNFNFQKSSGQLEKTSNIKKTKKEIARLKFQLHHLKTIGSKDA
tara:strand:+ start:34 stop:240 length:207 start_codon:yes stop_codon:yes gene_type:complete